MSPSQADVARIRALLELRDADDLEVLRTTELPNPPTGYAAGLDVHREPLLALVERAPHFAEPKWQPFMSEASAPPTDLPVHVVRWESSPTVAVAEPERDDVSLEPIRGSSTPWRGGAILLHLGSDPAIVRVNGLPGEVLLVGEPPGRAGPGAALHFVRVTRQHPSAFEDPMTEVLSGLSCEDWLRTACERLQRHGSPFHRAAALGLFARLWVPKTRAEQEDALRTRDTAAARVARVASLLSRSDREALAVTSFERAERLSSELTELAAAAVERPKSVPALASAVIEARDDLASVLWLLEHAGEKPSAKLVEVLDALDAEARAHLSVFAFAPDLGDDERVQAVFEIEPDAWWGAFVLS